MNEPNFTDNGTTPNGETEGLLDPEPSNESIIADPKILSSLISLGIASQNACIKAAMAVHNTSVEEAVEWLFSHLNDTNINNPIQSNDNSLKQWCLQNGFSLDLFHRLKKPPIHVDSLQKLKHLTSQNDINDLVQELGLRFGKKAAFIQAMLQLKNIDIETADSSATKGNKLKDSEPWKCVLCEYINIGTDELCTMCSTEKPKPKPKSIPKTEPIENKSVEISIAQQQINNDEKMQIISDTNNKPDTHSKSAHITQDNQTNDGQLSCNLCKKEFTANDWNQQNVMLDFKSGMCYIHITCSKLKQKDNATTDNKTSTKQSRISEKQKISKSKVHSEQKTKEEKIDDCILCCHRCKEEFSNNDWNTQNVIMDKGMFYTHLICKKLNKKNMKHVIKKKTKVNSIAIIDNINKKFTDHESYCELKFSANPSLTEDEIEGNCHIRDIMIPYRNLKESNFLQLYDKTKSCPNYDDIIAHLPEDLIDDFKECYKTICRKYSDHIVGRTCVQAWTHEDNQFTACKFYCKLNAALLSDHSELLKEWMYLIRGLNKFLVNTRPKEKIICYRKSDLSLEQFNRIKVGKKYRIAMYTATSTDKEFVKKWNRNSGTFYWMFNVPAGCYNACCIAEYSYHGEESEVLMPPYSSIKIVSKTDGYITANVLDNKNCSMDLPTIVA